MNFKFLSKSILQNLLKLATIEYQLGDSFEKVIILNLLTLIVIGCNMFITSEKIELSPVRKFMLWVFGSPSNDPYVNVNLDIEFDKALLYLELYNKNSPIKISIHHLLLKSIADAFKLHPRLNVKVFGDDIYRLPSVNIATPINLVKKAWNPSANELGLAIVRSADEKKLPEVAKDISGEAKNYAQDNQGTGTTLILEEIVKFLYRYLPDSSLRLFFRGMSLFGHNRVLHDLMHEFIGISTMFTNLGSILRPCPGIHYKSGAFSIPDKLVHFATCFGAGPIEKKPFVENDQIVIKSVIPMMIIFDHRVVDGFLISRFIEDVVQRLQCPEAYFGWPDIQPTISPSENTIRS